VIAYAIAYLHITNIHISLFVCLSHILLALSVLRGRRPQPANGIGHSRRVDGSLSGSKQQQHQHPESDMSDEEWGKIFLND